MYQFRLPFLALLALVAAFDFAHAQQATPGLPLGRLDIVTPCGAKIGTSVEVLLTGADLDEPTALVFSHPGIKAELSKDEEPKPDPKNPKKEMPVKKKGPVPGVAAGRFNVTVGANVPVGQYDVRVVHKWGVSNPRFFCVGDMTEVQEREPNNDVAEAQRIELNTTINGVISVPTDVDFFLFAGKKNQRVILSCLTSSIDSKSRPMIEVFDLSNKRVAFNRNYNGNDALADAILPEDGDYLVRLSEFTYTQGGPQYFYRLTISTAPWIDAIFPPMVEAGKPTQVTIYGRNLPGGTPEPGTLVEGRPVEKAVITITPPADPKALTRLSFNGRIDPRSGGVDGFEYRLKGLSGSSNPMLIALTTAKVVLEKENNDRPDTPEEIPVPCEVAGRIDKRQDRDWYAFNAKKGDIFLIDLWCDRLGVPADLYFSFKKDKAPNEIEEDDNPDILNLQQFYNRTADPKPHRFVAAEDGRYLIGVGSRESNFSYGPRITYRLRVVPESPDFRLIVMPATNNLPDTTVLRADGNVYLDVFAYRNDGFNGVITLSADGLPPGVTCQPSLIGTGMKQGTLVLSAAANATTFDGVINVKGTATVGGKLLVREARPATISWGVQQAQNLPSVARLDQQLYISIRDKAPFKVLIEPENAFLKAGEKLPQPLMVKMGEKLTIPYKAVRQADSKTPISVYLLSMGAPQGLGPLVTAGNNQTPLTTIAADKNEGNIVLDIRPAAVPGSYTVVFKATTPIQYANPANKKNQTLTIVAATNPLTFIVLPTAVAKLTANPRLQVVAGMNGELAIKVERQFDYTGEFKIKLVLPPNTKGLTANEVTLPAGKDEVMLPIQVAADAAVGTFPLSIIATAMVEGKVPIAHEVKSQIVVDKAKDKK